MPGVNSTIYVFGVSNHINNKDVSSVCIALSPPIRYLLMLVQVAVDAFLIKMGPWF